jgi:hypothetical protein
MLMQGLLRDVRYGIRTLTKNPDYPFTRWLAVTPSFFKTLDVPIVDGRGFTVADRPGALPVAIVNKAFVQ